MVGSGQSLVNKYSGPLYSNMLNQYKQYHEFCSCTFTDDCGKKN